MPLSSEDVVRKSFRTRLRGYDTGEVDAFLEEVVFELRRMESQVDELRAEVLTLGRGGVSAAQQPRLVDAEQLELVRIERAELVRDIAALQEQHDMLQAGLRAGEHDGPTDDGPSQA